jgi:type IV secretion system protein VirB4
MLLLALTRKWQPAPRLVLFDLDRGSEIAMRALGGRYFTSGSGQADWLQPLAARPHACARPVLGATDSHLHRDTLDPAAAGRRAGDCRRGAVGGHDAAGLRRFSTVANLPKAGENSLYERLGRWCEAARWAGSSMADDRLSDLARGPAIAFDTTEFLDRPRCAPRSCCTCSR